MGKIICVENKSYPSENSGYANISIVLVEGQIGDYATYIGQGSPEWIAQNGDKLSFNAAKIHFPIGLDKNKYRE